MDSGHLAEQQIKAEAELRDADGRFRLWVANYVGEEPAALMNLGSSTQIQTLLFGGFTSTKKVSKKVTKAEKDAAAAADLAPPQATNVCPSVDAVCLLVFFSLMLSHAMLV